jgi:hypothetical protein
MKYKFYKKTIKTTGTTYYLVDSEKTLLSNIDFTKNNFNQINEIIEGIETSKDKPLKQEYIWANEDLTLYSNKNGVLLIDMLGQRAGIDDVEKLSLQLQHEEMITFLKDFKKFVQENS